MASAQFKETFNCTAAEFYKIIVDYEKYPLFLTEVKEVKIYKDSGDTKEMEYTVSVIKTFKYKIRATGSPGKGVTFEFLSGDFMKKMNGSWTLTEQDGGKCQVEYKVDATFGMLVPESVTKTVISANLPMMVTNLKKRVKELYGK